MPRKASEEKKEVKTTKKSSKTVTKKPKSKTATAKTVTKKTTATKKAKAAPSKKAKTTKATTARKETKSISTASKKTTTTKKAKAKTTVKKTPVKRTTKSTKQPKEVLEYYDLPYAYNKTIVKILAQTPNTLFVYWEVSDEDKNKFVKKYGEDFFNNTYPVLIVHNKTKDYAFEIEINDFANSWYFNVSDTKCDYEIEYGRKVRLNTPSLSDNYIYIASSNEIESPNDHILFEKEQKVLFFRNTKTNYTYSKDIASMYYINHLKNLHRIYDFYNKAYQTEDLENIENPSSNFSCF